MRISSSIKRKMGFKSVLANTAMLLGESWTFPYIGHMPQTMRKSILEEYFTAHEDVMLKNMSCRLRESHQINPQELCYILGLRAGLYEMRSRKGLELYLKPKAKAGYVEKKLASFDRTPQALSICVNSLDEAAEADRKLIFDWLDRLIMN